MKKTSNLYLDMIEYGLEHITDGITKDKLRKHLESIGYDLAAKGFIFTTIFDSLFYREVHDSIRENSDTHYMLNERAYFDFIQYKSYKQSIRQAKRANCFSTIAIVISIATFILSIGYSLYPM